MFSRPRPSTSVSPARSSAAGSLCLSGCAPDPPSGLSEQISADLTTPASASIGVILSTAGRLSATLVSAVTGAATPASATTDPPPPDDTPPSAPADLAAIAAGPDQVDLTWTAAVDDPESGVDSYNVYRDGEFVAATANTTFADIGLEPGTTYMYRVSAVNGAGLESDLSAAASATTQDLPDTTPSSPPTRLRFAP